MSAPSFWNSTQAHFLHSFFTMFTTTSSKNCWVAFAPYEAWISLQLLCSRRHIFREPTGVSSQYRVFLEVLNFICFRIGNDADFYKARFFGFPTRNEGIYRCHGSRTDQHGVSLISILSFPLAAKQQVKGDSLMLYNPSL